MKVIRLFTPITIKIVVNYRDIIPNILYYTKFIISPWVN